MPRAVGLDIGRTSVRVASVDVSAKRTKLLGYGVMEIEPGLSEEDHRRATMRAIDDLFKQHRFDRANVICSLDSEACILRDITVPFKSTDQIDKIIRFEAEHHLVATSIDDVVVDYMKVGEIGEKSRLFLVAARKEGLRERLSMLSEVGIDPYEFGLDAIAIYTAVTQMPLASEHDNFVILDVGAQHARIMVVEERGLSHVRVSRIAAEGGQTEGMPEDPTFDRTRQTYLDRLVKVLRQFVMSVRLRNPPERIVLTGEVQFMHGLAAKLEAEFELPTSPLGLANHITHDLAPDLAYDLDAGVTAVGLALKGAGVDRGGMTFRKDDLAYQRRFEQVRLHLVSLSMLTFLLAFVPAAYFFKLKTERERQYDAEFTQGKIFEDPNVRDRGVLPEINALSKHPNLGKATGLSIEELDADLERVASAGASARISRATSLLDKYEGLIDERLGQSQDVPQIESALLVLGDVFKMIKEAADASPTIRTNPLRITELDLTPQQLTLKFWSPEVRDAELIKSKLELLQKSYFRDDPVRGVRFVGVEQVEDGGIVRTIKADRISKEEP